MQENKNGSDDNLFENFNHYTIASNYIVDNIRKIIEYKAREQDNKIQNELFKELITKYVSLAKDLENKVKEVTILSITDPLTKIYNRLKFTEELEREIRAVKRYRYPLALIMLDIDHFKNINDTYGHDMGDAALIKVVDIVRRSIRTTDIFARWGGEEFMLLLPHTGLKSAGYVADKLRKIIEGTNIPGIKKMTCSFGVAAYDQNEHMDSFVKRVDNALYRAKNSGRNRVELDENTDTD